jgi:hypothetical protein
MSVRKLPFEIWDEFPLIREHLGTGDFSRASCQNTGMRLPAGLAAWVPECEPISAHNFGYPEWGASFLQCGDMHKKIPRPSGGLKPFSRRARLALVIFSAFTTVLDATLARVLLLLIRTLAATLLSALVSRVLLLLTNLLLSTMLLAALATLLVLLAALLILLLAHTVAPLQRSLGEIILANHPRCYSRNISCFGTICPIFEPPWIGGGYSPSGKNIARFRQNYSVLLSRNVLVVARRLISNSRCYGSNRPASLSRTLGKNRRADAASCFRLPERSAIVQAAFWSSGNVG